jgi:hypothetical protein
MTKTEFIREGTLGGPGLDGYAYCADVYCVDCGEKIYTEIAKAVAPTLADTDDPLFSDSETCPQPIFFGESDSPQHCSDCGEYLYGERSEANEDSEVNGEEEGK